MFKKIMIALLLVLALPAASLAAWTIYISPSASCANCGIYEDETDAFVWRIKMVSDGTTLVAAESPSLLPALNYIGKYLYDVTIENPASGGPGDTWNLEIQDSGVQAGAIGKSVIGETGIDNTASTDVIIHGYTETGKYEKILGRLRLLVSDTDMGNTEYVTVLLTFVK